MDVLPSSSLEEEFVVHILDMLLEDKTFAGRPFKKLSHLDRAASSMATPCLGGQHTMTSGYKDLAILESRWGNNEGPIEFQSSQWGQPRLT